MNLLELERTMAAAVMRPLTVRDGMRKRLPQGGSVEAEAEGFIKPNQRLSSFERLEIYNRQYWFRILSSFSEDFPALEATIGPKQFDLLARAYLAENPSRSFTLRNLGSNLETWLRANSKWAGRRHAVALDVVRLEWAYIEAFDNGQEPSLTLADLAGLGADSCLALQPHVRLLKLDYAVDDFIVEVHRRQISSSVASNAVTSAGRPASRARLRPVRSTEVWLAVHRFDHAVFYKRLEREAYRLLEQLRNNHPLSDALEEAFGDSKIRSLDRPARVREWFASWAELGWFCGHRQAPSRARTPEKRKKR